MRYTVFRSVHSFRKNGINSTSSRKIARNLRENRTRIWSRYYAWSCLWPKFYAESFIFCKLLVHGDDHGDFSLWRVRSLLRMKKSEYQVHCWREKKMQLLTSYSNLNNKIWKRHPGFHSLTLARFNSRADLFLKQILLKSNWWLHRERFSPCHNLARAENPSPVCHTMMYLENRSPVCYTGLGISARANVLKNLKKSHIIDTEFRPGLKN